MKRLAASDFHCLAEAGTRVMLSGVDARAVFIVKEDGIEQPGLSLFKDGSRQANFEGLWNAMALRDWVYSSIAGLAVLTDEPSLTAFASSADKTAVPTHPQPTLNPNLFVCRRKCCAHVAGAASRAPAEPRSR